MENEKILRAGEIAIQVKEYIKPLIKKDTLLIEIAEKIENKIYELGGKPAFPVNLSINEIAAHYTPSHNDTTKAKDLLKIDFGAHIDGWCSDTAFSVNLSDNQKESEENEKLITASRKALESGQNIIASKTKVSEIGKEINRTIQEQGFIPITNLTGHEIGQYDLHAGLSIPNYNNKCQEEISEGLYAIEPFVTLSSGNGHVREGEDSGIYQIISDKKPRSPLAREILNFILDEYGTLPFCSRWIIKKFGIKANFGLRQLEQNNNLHQYPQLIESSGKKVAQSENTILIQKNKKTITTDKN
jgi:methionyl aminopeptidase